MTTSDVFLRELVSNANDALEKLRLTALTDKEITLPDEPLNITIKAVKDTEGKGGRLIITDYGIGMSPEELTTNLGTLAKSGTSDFLARAENQNTDGTGQGNLIGAFGLGFYSSFLVSNRVYVASIPPKSSKNPNPVQHVFSSSADESSFELYEDPRGNTIGRGTEITLVLKDDATDFLEEYQLKASIRKHSAFSSTFPIYLHTSTTEDVPDEDELEITQQESEQLSETPKDESEQLSEALEDESEQLDETPGDESGVKDEDEAIVEDVEDVKVEEEVKPVKMKTVVKEEWVHLNSQPPIWTRDPKDITDEEYISFYKATYKDMDAPLAWHHFSGDAGTGSSFKAILFIPSKLPADFWHGPTIVNKDVRLFNKRVFITNDFGEDTLPKWISWLKAIIDAEDLPLNVSRETLQSTRFLHQIKQALIRRLIQLIQRISDEDPEKFDKISNVIGSPLKLGAVDAEKDRPKLAALTRFATNQRNATTLDEYVKNKKKGQKQIFFLGGLGQAPEALAKSLFVEKLTARGYEVLLCSEPLDEILFSHHRTWEKMAFQDVSKAGLKFDEDPEEEKAKQAALKEKFHPLIEWLKNETMEVVMDVSLSNRLVTSPCAIVSEMFGYSANMERLMNAQNSRDNSLKHAYAKKAKSLEINPHSPLIEGMLRKVEQLPEPDDEPDVEAEEELREVTSILIDGALIRSGYDVPDVNVFFERMDRALRRSLGVSEHAKTVVDVKPAPPVDPEPIGSESIDGEPETPKAFIEVPEHLKGQVEIEMEEMPDEDEDETDPIHDEL
ncbi:cation-transporting ATPase [Hysterangium stoloniferum]|nr:cation-transporting ATPase [Hysterangium stoloniferum]